jgi:hypothetical protein
VHAFSHSTQSDDTVYKFRLSGCAIVLVLQCLVMTLPTLKFLQVPVVSEWSWLWVTLPIWSPSVLLAVVLAGEKIMQLANSKVASPVRSLVVEPSPANC